MGTALPSWGVFRLIKSLESRSAGGRLVLRIGEGRVTLRIRNGRVVAVDTNIEALSFFSFLSAIQPARKADFDRLRAELDRPDIPEAKRCVWSFAESVVEKGIFQAEAAPKLVYAHARHAMQAILPARVDEWTFSPDDDVEAPLSRQPLELLAELMRAVARHPDIAAMRKSVTRLTADGNLSLSSECEPVLAQAQAHIGEAPVLAALRSDAEPDYQKHLSNDQNVRVLFALAIGGYLTRPLTPMVTGAVEQSVSRELRSMAAEIPSQNHYEVLGLPSSARISFIDAAVQRMRRRFTRARFEGLVDAETLGLLDKINERLDEARSVLSDRGQRTAYNRSIGISTPSLDTQTARIFDARALWVNGMALLAARKTTEALAQFEQARSLDSEEPLYLVAAGRALLSQPPNAAVTQQAFELLTNAIKANEEIVDAHVLLSQVHRLQGRNEDAMNAIKTAIRLDPENAEARTQLEVLKGKTTSQRIVVQKPRESVVDYVRKWLKKG